jgi:hypothetical protein
MLGFAWARVATIVINEHLASAGNHRLDILREPLIESQMHV